MNKKILTWIAVVATVAIAGWNVSQNRSDNEVSDVALANIEALAQGESSDYCNQYCSTWPFTYCVLETSTSYIFCMEKYPN